MSEPEPFWEPARCLDDAALSSDDLDAHYDLVSRWPEPRLLNQTKLWVDPDHRVYDLDDLDLFDLDDIFMRLVRDADRWHAQACRDERAALSTAMAWVHSTLAIPLVEDLDPSEWLRSTELVRDLCARLLP